MVGGRGEEGVTPPSFPSFFKGKKKSREGRSTFSENTGKAGSEIFDCTLEKRVTKVSFFAKIPRNYYYANLVVSPVATIPEATTSPFSPKNKSLEKFLHLICMLFRSLIGFLC